MNGSLRVKPEVLAKKDTVGKTFRCDLTDVNNLCAVENVKVRSAANWFPKKLRQPMQLKFEGLKQMPEISWYTWSKIERKTSFRYKFTLYISSVSPTQIATGNHDFSTDLLSKLCFHLVECNWISSLCTDCAETFHKFFIKSTDVKERMKAFTLDLRIDTLYMELLKTNIEFREVVKNVLILLYGNAGVEAGASINEDVLSENMSEEALVAHRIVYNGVANSGGSENVRVNKEMMKYVDKAPSQYLHHLKASKENQTIAEKKKAEKRNLSYGFKKAKEAKQKCTEQLQRKAAEYDTQIFYLEEQLRKQ